MNINVDLIFNVSGALYLLASLLAVFFFATEKKWIVRGVTLILIPAFCVHSYGILLYRMTKGFWPLTSMSEYMSLFAWITVISFFIVSIKIKNKIVALFIVPMIFMLFATSSLLPSNMGNSLAPALKSNWLKIHVSFAIFGEVAFLVAFVSSLLYLLKLRFDGVFSVLKQLPDLRSLENIAFTSSRVGYPLFTVGALFAGAIWAEQAWGTFWSWDPKEVFSLIVWLVYTFYFHVKVTKNWSGVKTALILITGFLLTLLTIFSSMFMGGMHSYG